jgi:hypothetical protein
MVTRLLEREMFQLKSSAGWVCNPKEARPLSLSLVAQLIIAMKGIGHIAISLQIPSSRTFWAWDASIGQWSLRGVTWLTGSLRDKRESRTNKPIYPSVPISMNNETRRYYTVKISAHCHCGGLSKRELCERHSTTHGTVYTSIWQYCTLYNKGQWFLIFFKNVKRAAWIMVHLGPRSLKSKKNFIFSGRFLRISSFVGRKRP